MMIIDEDFPLDFTGEVYKMATLSTIKKSFAVPMNKKDLIPLHKKMQCKSRVILWKSFEAFSI